jgi:hypothetical protein
MAQPTKIKFEFEKDIHYRTVMCSGAWGGLTPEGRFHFDLYYDVQPVPERLIAEIDEKSKVASETTVPSVESRLANPVLSRQVVVGVNMSAEVAAAFSKLLLDKLAERERVIAKSKETSDKR